MDKAEIKKEIGMSYETLCDYLIGKYGPAKFNYFPNTECRSRDRRVTRTDDGLYCHHRREDFALELSNPRVAKKEPFEWQLKENLVYCNLIEHLILHIKISVLQSKTMLHKPSDIGIYFISGGIRLICSDIIGFFKTDLLSVAWKKRCFEEINDNYLDFLEIINAMFLYIESHYDGDKEREKFLAPGQKVLFSDASGKILKVSKDSKHFLLELDNGKEMSFSTKIFSQQMSFQDYAELTLKELCTVAETYYEDIYESLISMDIENSIAYGKLFEIDFKGYGFPQFTHNYLDFKEYGSRNVDEYLYKGLPSTFGNPADEIITEVPTFWKGSFPKKILNKDKYNYIIRVNTAFHLKPQKKAFIKYKGNDYYSLLPNSTFSNDNDNNRAFRNGIILENTYYFDRKTNKYYPKIIDEDGNIKHSSLILTIARADIEEFFNTYDIELYQFLDGCYWEIKKE